MTDLHTAAMKLALNAFSMIAGADNLDWIQHQAAQQAAALSQALAEQPAQQQPAWRTQGGIPRFKPQPAQQEPVAHCEAGPEYCQQCYKESVPTYGSEEVRKLREVIESQAKIIALMEKNQGCPPFWPVVQHLLDEYGLQLIDIVASYKQATEQPAQQEWIETACALIKAADDAAHDSDYMLDSNDCIKVLRGEWKGHLMNDQPTAPQPAQQSGIKQVIELYDSPEQPAQQEPYCWMSPEGTIYQASDEDVLKGSIPMYLGRTPAQRKPLTDEQILAANYPDGEENGPTIAAPDFELICFARQIEAKLNEKNI